MKTVFLVMALLLSFHAVSAIDNAEVCSDTTEACVYFQKLSRMTTYKDCHFRIALRPNSEPEAKLIKIRLGIETESGYFESVPPEIREVAEGTFNVTRAIFTRPGLWQIRVTYKLEDVVETLIIPVGIEAQLLQ